MKKKEKPSIEVPNNSTSKQVVNERSSIGGSSSSGSNSSGSGGSGVAGSGSNSGSSSDGIGSSGGGSSSGNGSSGSGSGAAGSGSGSVVGGGGSGSVGANSSNNSIEDIYRSNTLKSRILKILEENDFYKNEKEAIKNYIDSMSDEVPIVKYSLQQAKKIVMIVPLQTMKFYMLFGNWYRKILMQ